MNRFVDLLVHGLKGLGHEVQLARPSPFFGRIGATDSRIGKLLGTLDRFILFPFVLRRISRDVDIVHIPDHGNAIYLRQLGRIPNVVTCHDMQPYRSALGEIRENSLGYFARIYQRWVLSWIKRAQSVACISDATRNDWVHLCGADAMGRSVVIPPSLTYPYSPMAATEANARVQKLLNAEIPHFILHVGSNVWYKNRLGLVQIFGALAKYKEFSQVHLVIAGRRLAPDALTWLEENGLRGRLHQTGIIGNEDLRALYSTAALLLFPSLFEGFGMPIIEAQACGCLVATTNRQPMCHVGGEGAIYFDVSNPAKAAISILAAWPEREDLIAKGQSNIKRYSEQSMLSEYVELYKRVISNKQSL